VLHIVMAISPLMAVVGFAIVVDFLMGLGK